MMYKTTDTTKQAWDTIVIGGGQAGLATGYYLKQFNEDFLILDANSNTGDSWRKRWDSLRLFTPGWNNALPGMTFPGPVDGFPSKNEVADFLLSYQGTFNIPVRHNCEVLKLVKVSGGYEINTNSGMLYAKSVIVATGAYQVPRIPKFASQLDQSITQIHSSAYKNAFEVQGGRVLVVGAGTSGLQIALDIASDVREVYVAGTPPMHIPDFVFKYFGSQFVWFATHILNTSTPMGRKVQKAIKTHAQGAPLINISIADIKKAGIKHLSRIAGVTDGLPVTANGESLGVSTVIWATGFLPDYSWIGIEDCFDENGYPLTKRGVSTVSEGLFFVGSMFQYGLTSTWLGGVGRDAEYICKAVHQFNKK